MAPTEAFCAGVVAVDLCKSSKDTPEVCPCAGAAATAAAAAAVAAAAVDLCEGAPITWKAALEWTLDFPIATVWELTRDFASISKWLPSYMRASTLVAGSPQQPGCVRSVLGYEEHIPAAYDKLLELDERNHKFRYIILTCHLPLLMGHSPTFHFLEASPTSTTLKFSSERPPVPNMVEEDYRAFVQKLYSGFVADLISTLSTTAY